MPKSGDGTSNLEPLGEAGSAGHLFLTAPGGGENPAHATVSVNSMGPMDTVQIAASGLQPGKLYTLWLVTSRTAPFGRKEELATFKTNLAGAQVAQAIGPLREVLTPASANRDRQRFLLLTPAGSETPVLTQRTP